VPVIRFFVKLVEKQNQIDRLDWAFVLSGSYLEVVSLHVWIVVFSGVAIIYILSHLNKAEAMKK
jgi:hypothetical protein